MLGPLFYTVVTRDCPSSSSSSLTVKYTVATAVLGLAANKETEGGNEVKHLLSWCDTYNLALNSKKTTETIVDFGRDGPISRRPLFVGSEVERRLSSQKFEGVTVAEDLSRGPHTALAVGEGPTPPPGSRGR